MMTIDELKNFPDCELGEIDTDTFNFIVYNLKPVQYQDIPKNKSTLKYLTENVIDDTMLSVISTITLLNTLTGVNRMKLHFTIGEDETLETFLEEHTNVSIDEFKSVIHLITRDNIVDIIDSLCLQDNLSILEHIAKNFDIISEFMSKSEFQMLVLQNTVHFLLSSETENVLFDGNRPHMTVNEFNKVVKKSLVQIQVNNDDDENTLFTWNGLIAHAVVVNGINNIDTLKEEMNYLMNKFLQLKV